MYFGNSLARSARGCSPRRAPTPSPSRRSKASASGTTAATARRSTSRPPSSSSASSSSPACGARTTARPRRRRAAAPTACPRSRAARHALHRQAPRSLRPRRLALRGLDVHLRVQLARRRPRNSACHEFAQLSSQFGAHLGANRRASAHCPTPPLRLSRARDARLLRRRRDDAAVWAHLRDVHGGVRRLLLLRARLRPHLVRGAAAQRLVVAAAALSLPLYSSQTVALLISFLAFEAVVGVYWPAIGAIESRVVPEEARDDLQRVPRAAQLRRAGVLLNDLAITTAFGACCAMLPSPPSRCVLSSARQAHEADVGRRRRRLRERPAEDAATEGGRAGCVRGYNSTVWGFAQSSPTHRSVNE